MGDLPNHYSDLVLYVVVTPVLILDRTIQSSWYYIIYVRICVAIGENYSYKLVLDVICVAIGQLLIQARN